MSSYRTRRLLALGGVVIAMAFTLPRFLSHTPYPRLGVRFDWNTQTQNPRVLSVLGPPGQGVLSKDDVILAVEGVPLTAKAVFEDKQGPKLFRRGAVQLTVLRHGNVLAVTVPPLVLSPWQRVRLYALPLVTVVAVPLVAILLVWRRPDVSAAWVFLLFAVLEAVSSIWQIFRFPQSDLKGTLKTYLEVYHSVVLWLPASFLHFMLVFPRPRWEGHRRVTSPWWWLVVACYLAPLALLITARVLDVSVDPMAVWFQAITFPLGSLALIDRYVRHHPGVAPPSTRERVLAVTVAVILCIASVIDLLPDEPRMMALFSMPSMQVFMTALFFAWLSTPFLIAYLIANDPVFDPRRLIARSLPYALLSGLLAAIYLGVVLFGQRWFAVATGEETMVFNVVAALILAFAFAPLRERMQRGLDRLYGRDPMALRLALEQSGRELLSALDPDEVHASVDRATERGLRRRVAIDWPEQGMPRLAEELREEERGPVETLLVQAGIRLENLSLSAQRAAAERRAVELRAAATRAELRALQAQVQPHFLFNALNALSYLTETDPPAAQRFTERLADMLRYTVEAGDRPAALLQEEIAFVEDYLGVARERYENPLTFEYHGPRDLLSTGVPPLLLQPLVENSLKHGCAADGRPLRLTLEASRTDDDWLMIKFVDDGMPNGANGRGLGVGLENLEQRLRHFGGPEAVVLTARTEPHGFTVTMRWRVESHTRPGRSEA